MRFVRCPHCREILTSANDALGIHVKCAACGSGFVPQEYCVPRELTVERGDSLPPVTTRPEPAHLFPESPALIRYVKCPHCREALTSADDALGIRIECAACGSSFVPREYLVPEKKVLGEPGDE